MKKILSVLCVAALLIGMLAVSMVSAGAVDSAKTAIDVKKGDEVTYSLHLSGVAKPVIGCDFSFYYDPEIFEVDSITDFNESTDRADWIATINPDLDGEVRGNWSILKGIDFSKERNFITIHYKAKKDAKEGHLSYFIRYMYDDTIFDSTDKPQITEYKFTCTVLQNGNPVIEKAQPELNVEETQKSGLFVNSVTGDSKDADPDIPNTVAKKSTGNTGANNNGGSNVSSGNVGSGSGQGNNNSKVDSTTIETKVVELGTTAEGYYVAATDADGNVTATSDEKPIITVATATKDGGSGGPSPVLWVIIALIVLAGGGAAAFFFLKKKGA